MENFEKKLLEYRSLLDGTGGVRGTDNTAGMRGADGINRGTHDAAGTAAAAEKTAPAGLRETLAASRQAFLDAEQKAVLSRAEFLIGQMAYLQKRWWVWQAVVLLGLWCLMVQSGLNSFVQSSMGILGPLFAVLMIPELWKNRSSGSVEVEGAAYYSLRQIYAARIYAFGLVDAGMLTLFLALSVWGARAALGAMLVRFLLPMTVTECICFRTLTSRFFSSEYAAVAGCLFWAALWRIATLHGGLYEAISAPVWAGILALAGGYLIYAVRRALQRCEAERRPCRA